MTFKVSVYISLEKELPKRLLEVRWLPENKILEVSNVTIEYIRDIVEDVLQDNQLTEGRIMPLRNIRHKLEGLKDKLREIHGIGPRIADRVIAEVIDLINDAYRLRNVINSSVYIEQDELLKYRESIEIYEVEEDYLSDDFFTV